MLINEIRDILKDSILNVVTMDVIEEETESLKSIKYNLRFYISSDKNIEDFDFKLSKVFMKRLELLADKYNMVVNYGMKTVTLMKIRKK